MPRKSPARKRKDGLTHLDAANRPRMVDVGGKAITRREARAEAFVKLPLAAARALRTTGGRTKKGPVIDTAIVAGVMAAKRTHELIPFCHPLALERCDVEIGWRGASRLRIRTHVVVEARTGVEMEALTAAGVAALTIYDMVKALSHEVTITDVRLLQKSGGKRDFRR